MFQEAPADQKLPHLLSGENLEEASRLYDAETKYLLSYEYSALPKIPCRK